MVWPVGCLEWEDQYADQYSDMPGVKDFVDFDHSLKRILEILLYYIEHECLLSGKCGGEKSFGRTSNVAVVQLPHFLMSVQQKHSDGLSASTVQLQWLLAVGCLMFRYAVLPGKQRCKILELATIHGNPCCFGSILKNFLLKVSMMIHCCLKWLEVGRIKISVIHFSKCSLQGIIELKLLSYLNLQAEQLCHFCLHQAKDNCMVVKAI
jgi:hypothetical protein